eukprot:341107-Rhodomonas_salina.1
MQSMMLSLPMSAPAFDGQLSQPEAAVMFWYDPAEQSKQLPDPFNPLYLPKPHAEHTAPSDPSYPARQMQSVMLLLPIREYVFDGQTRHADAAVLLRYDPAAQSVQLPDPFTPLYVPIAHAEHAAPSQPSCPTSQMQSLMLSLPVSEYVLNGQLWQPEAAVLFWYDPATQPKHVPDPFMLLYFPASHATHGPPSAP